MARRDQLALFDTPSRHATPLRRNRRGSRRNGIVKVPASWHATLTDMVLAGQNGMVYLPLSDFPYASIAAKLQPIYPDGQVPVKVQVGGVPPGVAGATSPKSSKGYYKLAFMHLDGAQAASTALHELRHLVQYLGDEVLKQHHPKGAFGRPSKAAMHSLRSTKALIKYGAGPKAQHKGSPKYAGVDPYFTSASEWQPWVGSTSDKIVGKLVAKGIDPRSEDGRKLVLEEAKKGRFYQKTDPDTRRELLRQVYVEVMRQAAEEGIIPAKWHGKQGSKPPPSADPMAQLAAMLGLGKGGHGVAGGKPKPKKPTSGHTPKEGEWTVMWKVRDATSRAPADWYGGKGSGGSTMLYRGFSSAGAADAFAAEVEAGQHNFGGWLKRLIIRAPDGAETKKKNRARRRRR